MNKIIIVHYEEDPAAIDQFKILSHRLWDEHISYTRDGIISSLSGLENLQTIIDRLMKNQEDIGQLLAPFYGKDDAETFTKLLKTHIMLAGDIITAIKDSKSTVALETAWNTNAEEIATFLDSLDPDNWPKETVLAVLKKHLACTLDEVNAIAKKDWVAGIAAYDACSLVIAQLAYAVATGIVDKFPEAFTMQYTTKSFKR